MNEDTPIELFAAEFGVDPQALLLLLADLQQHSAADAFYIFWNISTPGVAAPQRSNRPRTLLAFTSADAALAFAQRNQMSNNGRPPRLRRLLLLQLIRAIVREPTIESLLLADMDHDSPPGQLPAGVVILRAEILQRLQI